MLRQQLFDDWSTIPSVGKKHASFAIQAVTWLDVSGMLPGALKMPE